MIYCIPASAIICISVSHRSCVQFSTSQGWMNEPQIFRPDNSDSDAGADDAAAG